MRIDMRSGLGLLCASLIVLGVARGFLSDRGVIDTLRPATDTMLSSIVGAANGKCCDKDSGGACSAVASVLCTVNMNFDCNPVGKNCSLVIDISKHDRCVTGVETDNCVLAAVAMCLKQKTGTCKDEEQWSWALGEWICGCAYGAPAWDPALIVNKCNMAVSNNCILPE